MPSIRPFERLVRCELLSFLAAALLALVGSAGCGGEVTSRSPVAQEHGPDEKALVTASGTGKVAIVTQRYDNQRTGLNAYETALTPTSMASGTFRKQSAFPVDGAVYAQPLVVPAAITTADKTLHDVVFVATENNSVYALDAATLNLLWQARLMTTTYGAPAGTTTVSSSDVRCSDISPQYGITGTPVIDVASGTLYVVSNTKEGHTRIVYRLHALDITTGAPKGASVVIDATVSGSGAGSRRGSITFNPTRHLQRPGLLLTNGTLAIAFSGHCDVDPYHGWVMTYDAASLTQKAVWTTAPNGSEGGIWMAGGGVTTDDNGYGYVSVGNGTYDGSTAFGNSVVRLDLANLATHPVVDSFTPWNQATLASQDLDVGSGGVLLALDRSLLVAGSKDGTLYVMSASKLGGYGSTNGNLQTITGAAGNGLYATPAYWNGSVYFQGKGQPLQAYVFQTGTSFLHQSWQGATSSGFPGASAVVSATSPTATTAIVWTLQTDGFGTNAPPILHAYEAVYGTELYSSATALGDAASGTAVKFTVPVVANGSVYVGSSGYITRFGLEKPAPKRVRFSRAVAETVRECACS